MKDSKKYIDWINQAKQDLDAAIILFKYNGPKNIVAFHSHQAIEKYAKQELEDAVR